MRARLTVSAICAGLAAKPGASTRTISGIANSAPIRIASCASICQEKISSAKRAALSGSPRACSAA